MRPLYLAAGHMLGSRPLSVGGTDLLQLHLAAGTGPYDRWSTNMTGGPVSYPNRTAVDRLLRAQIGAPQLMSVVGPLATHSGGDVRLGRSSMASTLSDTGLSCVPKLAMKAPALADPSTAEALTSRILGE